MKTEWESYLIPTIKSFALKRIFVLHCIAILTSQRLFICMLNNELKNTECYKKQQYKGDPKTPCEKPEHKI